MYCYIINSGIGNEWCIWLQDNTKQEESKSKTTEYTVRTKQSCNNKTHVCIYALSEFTSSRKENQSKGHRHRAPALGLKTSDVCLSFVVPVNNTALCLLSRWVLRHQQGGQLEKSNLAQYNQQCFCTAVSGQLVYGRQHCQPMQHLKSKFFCHIPNPPNSFISRGTSQTRVLLEKVSIWKYFYTKK